MRLAVLVALTATSVGHADEPKPSEAKQKYGQIAREQQAASDAYQKAAADKAAETKAEASRAFRRVEADLAGRCLALVRDYPDDPAAISAFMWLNNRGHSEAAHEAGDIVIEHWAKDARLRSFCEGVRGNDNPEVTRLLLAAIEASPHKAVQGFARYSLGVTKFRQADRLANAPAAQREPYEREGERLLQEVVDHYADVKYFTTLGDAAAAELYAYRNLAIGRKLPALVGVDLDGKPISLADESRGKVTLVVFWATWCGPCLSAIKDEKAILARHAGKPFTIVAVNGDRDVAKAKKVAAEKGVPWRSFADGADGPIVTKWHVDSWPTLYLIDEKGVIRQKTAGLNMIGIREKPDGTTEQFSYLDDAVDKLVAEATKKK